MIDMVQFAARALGFPAARRPKPDYVCGECGSKDVGKDDIYVCNHCGKQASFSTKTCGGCDDFNRYHEWTETTCERCGFKDEHEDAVFMEPMAWHCRACGHVGEPRDLDRERWELAVGL